MPARAVEVATVDQIDKYGDGQRCLSRQQLDVERTTIGLQEHMRVGTRQGGRYPAAGDVPIVGECAPGRDG